MLDAFNFRGPYRPVSPYVVCSVVIYGTIIMRCIYYYYIDRKEGDRDVPTQPRLPTGMIGQAAAWEMRLSNIFLTEQSQQTRQDVISSTMRRTADSNVD
jgi:hypothetical protein